MSKAVKEMVASELRARYQGVSSACVVDLTGLDVKQQEKLRASLRESSSRLEVIKNSLARRAFAGGPLEPLGDALVGPCALVVSEESVVDAAKVLMEAVKEFDKLTPKQAIVEGDPELIAVEALSKMKSRKELVGDVAALLASPARRVAGCLTAPSSEIAGCLKTLADRAA